MPRSGSSFMSQLIEADESVAMRLSPFFSYGFRTMSYNISSATELRDWRVALLTTEDEFVLQNQRRASGEYPEAANTQKNYRILYIKDTRNFFDYVRLFFISEDINLIFLTRGLSTQLSSWLSSPEWKNLEKTSQNIIHATTRKKIEDNPTDEYWGIADNFYFTRLAHDFASRFPNRCIKISYEELVNGEFRRLKELDLQLDLDKVFKRFNLFTKGISKETPYSVYREQGYAGKNVSIDDLPSDLLETILNDKKK